MDMQIFGLLVQDGLASGAVYVLLALALVMVFTVTRIVFVPQGEFVSASVLTIAAFQQGQRFAQGVVAADCGGGGDGGVGMHGVVLCNQRLMAVSG